MKQIVPTYNPEVQQDTNHLFPVFLKLENLSLLIVGGGNVGLEKLRAVLLNAPNTKVKLVALQIKEELSLFAAAYPDVQLIQRSWNEEDIEGADIVIAAVNDVEESKLIAATAKEKGKLINVADKPELCDFYLGSIVQKGDLKIAISTNGKSPTTAKRLKEVMQETLPDELHDVVNNLSKIRGKLAGDFDQKVKTLNALTKVLVEKDGAEKEKRFKKIASYSLMAFGFMLIGHFIFSYLPFQQIATDAVSLYASMDKNFHWMLLAGFLAQLVDGALGMGYGVTSATVLLSAGVSPAAISGSIHTAEMFASGASGYSHYKFGNVNKKLFKTLLIPGVLGAILGAILLTKMGETHLDYLRPILAVYTLVLGLRILINAFRKQQRQKKFKQYGLLAGVGGFLDSFGGGGWGPIVTSTLIIKGRSPRFVIGSVSLTEFFVTLASAFTFFTLIGITHWQVILALLIGGLIAAPLAAKLTGKLPRKTSFILLGILVIFWSMRILIKII